jgi:hypothetical protein
MHAMDHELTALKAEMKALQAKMKAHDFILAAVAAHIQAIMMPGFLAAAFDSAASTAARLGEDRESREVLPLVLDNIKYMRTAFDCVSTRESHGH